MKYYETPLGLFAAPELPSDMDGAEELTEAEYAARLAYVREHAVHVPEEPLDEDEEELSDGEALDIITGGAGA